MNKSIFKIKSFERVELILLFLNRMENIESFSFTQEKNGFFTLIYRENEK